MSAELLNLVASFVLAARVLLTYDAVVGCAIAICTFYIYWGWGHVHIDGVKMDWNILSMSVIYPISQGIVMGFKRREGVLAASEGLTRIRRASRAASPPSSSRREARCLASKADRRREIRPNGHAYEAALSNVLSSSPRCSSSLAASYSATR